MTETGDRAAAAAPEQLPGDPNATYSKDYWDLVLEQLLKHQLFKAGLAVLAVLYGLAIFAPLISNDRPYKLVAIDYGAYETSLRGVGSLGKQAIGMLVDTEDPEAAAERAQRNVNAVATRLDTMGRYLGEADMEVLDAFEVDLREALESAAAGDALERKEAQALESRADLIVTSYRPLRGDGPDRSEGDGAGDAGALAAGKQLVPHTSYPLPSSLGGMSVGFMVLWVVLCSFPLWNSLWNAGLLGGVKESIRRARLVKWLVILGLPIASSLMWWGLVGGSAGAFDVAPYKQGLSEGTIVPVEAPLLAPVPYGYAELHKEESFRPPTWQRNAQLDTDGYYMFGLRQPKPDAVTGYLPPPTPTEVRFGEPWPNAPHRHLAGTDELGRDFFVRMLWGGRISLAVGIVSAALLTVIGVVMGAIAGYFGGWVDTAIMRLIEILQSIPAFFLILATMAFTDPDVVPPIIAIVIVIALVRWTGAARLVRGEFLRLREQEFVVASRALGFSSARTIFRHVLPNAMSPVLVNAAFSVAAGILTESAVSFLGFGVSHPDASWGSLVNESRSPEHWWIQVFPGLLIFLTVTCYNLVGDAVRDALDPKMKA